MSAAVEDRAALLEAAVSPGSNGQRRALTMAEGGSPGDGVASGLAPGWLPRSASVVIGVVVAVVLVGTALACVGSSTFSTATAEQPRQVFDGADVQHSAAVQEEDARAHAAKAHAATTEPAAAPQREAPVARDLEPQEGAEAAKSLRASAQAPTPKASPAATEATRRATTPEPTMPRPRTVEEVEKDVERGIAVAEESKAQAEALREKAGSIAAKATGIVQGAKHDNTKAKEEMSQATADRSKAAQLRRKAQEALDAAVALEKKAHHEVASAQADQQLAKQQLEEAAAMRGKEQGLESKSAAALANALAAEVGTLQELKDSRACVDMPGVQLKAGATPQTFGTVVMSGAVLGSSQNCTDWCQKHEECRQAIYSSEDGSCQLFGEAVGEAVSFTSTYNSSYCGATHEQEDMMAMLHKVFDMKPWVPDLRDCAWAGGDCSQSKCCANVCVPDVLFNNCDWYTCYAKDQYFAGCSTGAAPGGWNGTALGGHATMEVPKAPEGKLVQGTRLFCFSVVMWWAGPTMPGMDGEGVVANNFKDKGLGICQCDDWAMYDGLPTGSGHNIDSFVQAWNKVKEDGRYKRNDWVVKVDVDAVFFADRLKWHIQALRTPQGARVYLRNTFYKFQFLGAIEAMTKQAMDLYFDRQWQCDQNVGRQGGEDYWLLSCLEGIGVDYQTDQQLLRDKYAAQDGCSDDWVVAFHFYKSANGWNYCHDEAYNAWKAKNPGAA